MRGYVSHNKKFITGALFAVVFFLFFGINAIKAETCENKNINFSQGVPASGGSQYSGTHAEFAFQIFFNATSTVTSFDLYLTGISSGNYCIVNNSVAMSTWNADNGNGCLTATSSFLNYPIGINNFDLPDTILYPGKYVIKIWGFTGAYRFLNTYTTPNYDTYYYYRVTNGVDQQTVQYTVYGYQTFEYCYTCESGSSTSTCATLEENNDISIFTGISKQYNGESTTSIPAYTYVNQYRAPFLLFVFVALILFFLALVIVIFLFKYFKR